MTFGYRNFIFTPKSLRCMDTADVLLYTAKYFRKFYGKITGNLLPVHFPFFFFFFVFFCSVLFFCFCFCFLRAPVNIFRNQAQYGSKKICIAFGHIALKPYKGFLECCLLTYLYHILISKNVLQADARKLTGNGLAAGCQVFYRKVHVLFYSVGRSCVQLASI